MNYVNKIKCGNEQDAREIIPYKPQIELIMTNKTHGSINKNACQYAEWFYNKFGVPPQVLIRTQSEGVEPQFESETIIGQLAFGHIAEYPGYPSITTTVRYFSNNEIELALSFYAFYHDDGEYGNRICGEYIEYSNRRGGSSAGDPFDYTELTLTFDSNRIIPIPVTD